MYISYEFPTPFHYGIHVLFTDDQMNFPHYFIMQYICYLLNTDRLDWNLLSTATTAINAWLNPADRLMCEIRCMMLTLTRRTSAVIACIMTNALEVEGIKLPNKVIYPVKQNLPRLSSTHFVFFYCSVEIRYFYLAL